MKNRPNLFWRIAVAAALASVLAPALIRGRLARRLDQATTGDEGLTTLEWVVLALGVFLAAGAAIAVITTAVNRRLNQIN